MKEKCEICDKDLEESEKVEGAMECEYCNFMITKNNHEMWFPEEHIYVNYFKDDKGKPHLSVSIANAVSFRIHHKIANSLDYMKRGYALAKRMEWYFKASS